MRFVDLDGDSFYVDRAEYGSAERVNFKTLQAKSCGDECVTVLSFSPSDARAVAAEIIACADRIEGKDSGGPRKCRGCGETKNRPDYMTCISCDAILNDIPVTSIKPSTPTHTSHEALVSLAKAIAYLPASLRDELNALLAGKLKEALK